MKNHRIVVALVLCGAIVAFAFYLNSNKKMSGHSQRQEITICGSTLPVSCVTYKCASGYVVEDGTETMPGGGLNEKLCSDGTSALRASFEK